MAFLYVDDMVALHHHRPALNGNIYDAMHGLRHPTIRNQKTEVRALLFLLVHSQNGCPPFQGLLICRRTIIGYALFVIELSALISHMQ